MRLLQYWDGHNALVAHPRHPKGAARILGLKPTTLEARMKKLGIKRPGR